jgi:hypothetical protein
LQAEVEDRSVEVAAKHAVRPRQPLCWVAGNVAVDQQQIVADESFDLNPDRSP